MVELKKYNANPRNRKTTDCVVRAISVASGVEYNKVLDDLIMVYKDTGYHMGEKRTYEKVLELYGFEKQPMVFKENGTKYRVGEIDQLVPDYKVAVVSLANHLVAYAYGMLIDTWDCRKKSALNVYVKVRQFDGYEKQKYKNCENIKGRFDL